MARTPKVKVNLRGKERVFKNIRNLVGAARVRANQELNLIGEEIMADSKENYVPVDTGHLRSTGNVKHSENPEAPRLVVGLNYWAKYAAAVHEIPKGYRNGKTFKYLTKPLQAQEKKVKPRIERAVKEVLK